MEGGTVLGVRWGNPPWRVLGAEGGMKRRRER